MSIGLDATRSRHPGPELAEAAGSRNRDAPLFRKYPIVREVALSTGPAPTPYHVYDGHGVFIGGTADLSAVRDLLAPEQVCAVQTEDGEALMGVWICDFAEASLGAHHELQFSVFVSAGEIAPVVSHRLGLIKLMLTRPDICMLCHGLWNSTPTVVAYNREQLALNARASHSRIECDADRFAFSVSDQVTHAPILEGRLHRPRRQSLRANVSLLARLGLGPIAALARQPWIRMPIVNPVGAGLEYNAVAESFTTTDRSVLRYFDQRRDQLTFGDTPYRGLKFRPQLFQAMEGFKFVYLAPGQG